MDPHVGKTSHCEGAIMCHGYEYEGWFRRRLARPARDERPAQTPERNAPEEPPRAPERAEPQPLSKTREREPA